MSIEPPCGIPTLPEYQRLLDSERFLLLEQCADRFRELHGSQLAPYGRSWVADPFHQWSRQWEYCFAFTQIESWMTGHAIAPQRALDAGSGVTFFPFFLTSTYPLLEVACLDSDPMLAPIYAELNRSGPKPAPFLRADLRRIPCPAGHFQLVYCISVLEHTRNFADIIEEFRRVLAPGGRLIVTFDISLDGRADIPPGQARDLLDALSRTFPQNSVDAAEPLETALARGDIVTTEHFAQTRKDLLPWKEGHYLRRALGALRRRQWPGKWYKELTFCCHVFEG